MQLKALASLYVASSQPPTFAALGQAIGNSLSTVRDRIAPRRVAHAPAQTRNVLVVNGHPDPRPERFCAALSDAYASGAKKSNRAVRRLDIGHLTFLLAQAQGKRELIAHEVERALDMIRWAGHLTIVFPLWPDEAPQPLQQLLTVFAHSRGISLVDRTANARRPQTARTIVTMETPAFTHRSLHRAKGRAAFDAPSLRLPGVKMEAPTFIGCVNAISTEQRKRWLEMMHTLGVAGA